MSEQSQEREFAQGVYVQKQSFGKGKGEIIKVSLSLDEFIEWAQSVVNSRGYVNIDIKTAKKDPNKLYAELNTWTPAGDDAQEDNDAGSEEGDGLPF